MGKIILRSWYSQDERAPDRVILGWESMVGDKEITVDIEYVSMDIFNRELQKLFESVKKKSAQLGTLQRYNLEQKIVIDYLQKPWYKKAWIRIKARMPKK